MVQVVTEALKRMLNQQNLLKGFFVFSFSKIESVCMCVCIHVY